MITGTARKELYVCSCGIFDYDAFIHCQRLPRNMQQSLFCVGDVCWVSRLLIIHRICTICRSGGWARQEPAPHNLQYKIAQHCVPYAVSRCPVVV
ncbi:UNVERIFIED_CONTAM: hypothetical protein NCL1_05282 [Trichonephila clavipes]